MKKVINTSQAPAPIGPYNQAILKGDTLYTSGQIAIDPKTGSLVNNNIIAETEQVMQNMQAVLKEAGMDFTHVIKTSIFISNMENFTKINEVYARYCSRNSRGSKSSQICKCRDFNDCLFLIPNTGCENSHK